MSMDIKDKVTDLVRNQRTNLPTLPVVVNNIVVTARNPGTSATDLAGFIINDQAISTKVLRIANSAYYGMSEEVGSISRAIVVIGFREILSLALGMGVFSALSKEMKDGLFDMTEFWKHSIGVGFAAKKIAKKTGRISEESTVLVGLLHDIGKLIFSIYFPKEYKGVLEKAADEKVPLHKAEKEILGLDHAEMADLLMEQWKFPQDIVQAVRHHHDPSACRNGDASMAFIANTADFICHRSGIGQSGNKKNEKNNDVLENLNLSYGTVSILAEELRSERDQVEGFLEALS